MPVHESAFVGYRSMRNIRFVLRRLNVFVGDNGVGKRNGETWIRGLRLGGDVAE